MRSKLPSVRAQPAEQFGRIDLQRRGDSKHVSQPEVANATLNAGHVGRMEPGVEAKRLLRKAEFEPSSTNAATELL